MQCSLGFMAIQDPGFLGTDNYWIVIKNCKRLESNKNESNNPREKKNSLVA